MNDLDADDAPSGRVGELVLVSREGACTDADLSGVIAALDEHELEWLTRTSGITDAHLRNLAGHERTARLCENLAIDDLEDGPLLTPSQWNENIQHWDARIGYLTEHEPRASTDLRISRAMLQACRNALARCLAHQLVAGRPTSRQHVAGRVSGPQDLPPQNR